MEDLFYQLTSTGADSIGMEDDVVESYDGVTKNMSVLDFIAEDPENRYIENGGTEYYPDLVIKNASTTATLVTTQSGTLAGQPINLLMGGRRPRPQH